MENKIKYSQDIGTTQKYDVVVCGGGPAGCAAALSAGRKGLKTLLIEGMGQLGGMAITGMVSQWLGGRNQKGEWVVGGIFKELAREAASKDYAVLPSLNPDEKYHPYGWFNWFIHGVPLDPFSVDLLLDKKMEEAGVDVLFHTQVADVITEDDIITYVILYNRSGLMAVPAKAVIDATGNADIAERSGCETVKGRKKDAKMTPASLIFHVYNVNKEALTKGIKRIGDPKFRNLIIKLKESGEWDFPGDLFICTQLPTEGEYYINTIRLIGVDGTDGESISEGMKRGRKEIHKLMEILRNHFPGFSDAKIKAIAPQLGIRETRRIVGDFALAVEDLQNENTFDDCIGFSMYGWDLPHPDKPSKQPFAEDKVTGYTYKVSKGLSTPLPYRIMIPKPVNNLICPGRAVSVERQVLGPVRVMAPCMAMGEAAGMATGQVVRDNVAYSSIDVSELRQQLRKVGAIVDKVELPEIKPRIDQT
jgi:hypothetical protein